MLSSRAGLLCLMLCLVGPLAATEERLFIGQIRVDAARGVTAGAPALRYRLVHDNPVDLQAQLAGWIGETEALEGGVAFSLRGYPVTASPPADARHRDASFLIDYTEPVIQDLAGPIQQHYGERPSPPELERFVYDYIVDKNSANGFDVASMVARSQAGDCTEHAVLLTALLRMYGYPARTVSGLYVSLESPVRAYGHAWAEYYAEEGWTGLDGTRISDRVGAQHVPLSVVEDESIGYALGLMSAFQLFAIERIIVER